jgi:GNAT superfamily N-acetyltransferase
MYLQILSYIQDKERRLADLKEIFFLNAKNPPQVASEREQFFKKYAQLYTENWPDDTFFACDLDTEKTMGYLIGCRNSDEGQAKLAALLPSYTLFADMFKKFPAHLHMNVHPDFHGKGAGSFLVQEYIIELKKFRVKGAHIITAPDERNVQFYLKHKFKYALERDFNGKKLLFMGLSL